MLNTINIKLKNINVNDKQKRKYMISKSKIRSIHSSLTIEENSLSLFDVENISENKQIFHFTMAIRTFTFYCINRCTTITTFNYINAIF